MGFRGYDPEQDRESVKRIWSEVGWLEEDRREHLDMLLDSGTAVVADIRETAESLVITSPGEIRYLGEPIPMSGVMGVTTSRLGRRRGLATRLTAHALAEDATGGAMVAGLGVFDQGFYDKLGFGTGVQEVWHHLDPGSLRIGRRPRTPFRVEKDHWSQAHACRRRRMMSHGAVCFNAPEVTRSDMMARKKAYGLGYFEDEELTHHIWLDNDGYHGPHSVFWMAYQNTDQLLELLALLEGFGDQIYQVRMRQPPQIQLQDLMDRPFRSRGTREKGRFETKTTVWADWQLRICDLAGCLERTHLPGPEVRFNLELHDPIQAHLDASSGWRGIGGDYVVTLGPRSGVETGRDGDLPLLKSGVGAFTRLWMGILPAVSLAVTDQLAGPPDLLVAVDRVLAPVPEPHPDWDF